MASKIVIAELDIDINALLKSTTQLKAEIDRLKESQKSLTKEGDTSSRAFVQNAADLKTLQSAYSSNIKAISENTQAQADQANASKLVALALSTEVTSITEAREQNKLLNKLRNETNVSTAEGKKQLTELNAKLDQNNEFIKENADAYLQQKINIGNYSESIKDALSNLNPLNGGLSGFIQRSQEAGGVGNLLKTSLAGVGNGIIGVTRASLAFIATPIGAVIAVIGLALGAMYNYLKNTQSGIDAVTSVTRPLQAVMTALGTVVNMVGKALVGAFENPKKALTDLFNFVKQNLINRFTAFAEILEGIIELDFKKVTNGVLQAGTGVTNMTDKIQGVAKATGKFLDDAIKKGKQIDTLKKDIERSELAYQRAQIKTNDLIDQQLLITKDTSKSFAERGKAANEIIRLTEDLAKKEEAIIQKKIKSLQLEYSLKDAKNLTIEEQQKMIDLEKQLDDSQDRGLNARLEQQRVLSGLKKEEQAQAKENQAKELARQQQILDNALSKSKAELDVFLSSQGIKAKSLEDQLILNDQVYQKQLEINKKEFNATKKTEVDKLNFIAANNEAKNQLLQSNTELLIQEGQRELNIIINNANKSIDEKLKAEMTYQELRLAQGQINEQQYQDAINEIQTDYDKQRLDKRLADEQKERERQAINLENERLSKQLTFEQDVEIQREQNALKLEQELLQAEKTGADTQLIKDKYAMLDKNLTQAVETFKIQSLSNTFGQISELFGKQSRLGKAFALYQAGIDGYQGVMKAFNSQFIPGDPTSLPRAIGAGALAGAFAVKNIAGIAGAKFEKGGIQEIGGKRHSDGGTKFYGEDGTTFEAERGEGIGVLNRSAFSSFMDFNNRFNGGGSSSGFMQGGGIITQGVRPDTQNLDTIIDAITNIPAPIVAVEEIQSVGNRYVNIKSGADL